MAAVQDSGSETEISMLTGHGVLQNVVNTFTSCSEAASQSESCHVLQCFANKDGHVQTTVNGADQANKVSSTLPYQGEANERTLTIAESSKLASTTTNEGPTKCTQEVRVEKTNGASELGTEGQGHNDCPRDIVNSTHVIARYYPRVAGPNTVCQDDTKFPNAKSSPFGANLPPCVINTSREDLTLTGAKINGVEPRIEEEETDIKSDVAALQSGVDIEQETVADITTGQVPCDRERLLNTSIDTVEFPQQASGLTSEAVECCHNAGTHRDEPKERCSQELLNETSNITAASSDAIVVLPRFKPLPTTQPNFYALTQNRLAQNDREFTKRKGHSKTKGRLLKCLGHQRKSDGVNLEYLSLAGVTNIRMDFAGESSNFLREHGFEGPLSACTSLLSLSLDGSVDNICLDAGTSDEGTEASLTSTPTHNASLEDRWNSYDRRNVGRSSWPNIELTNAHKLSISVSQNFEDSTNKDFCERSTGRGSPTIVESSFITSAASDSSINVIHTNELSKDLRHIVRPNRLPLPPKKKDILRQNAALQKDAPGKFYEVNGNYCESKMNKRNCSSSKPSTPCVEEVHMEMLSPSDEDKRKDCLIEQTCLSEDKAASPTYAPIPIEPCCMVRCSTCGQIVTSNSNTPIVLSPDSSATFASRTQLIQNGLSPMTPDGIKGIGKLSKSASLNAISSTFACKTADFHPSRLTPIRLPRFNTHSEVSGISYEKQTDEPLGKREVLAPPLHENLQYHAFFMYHNNDRDWVLNVIEKLESATLGFRCCCHERDLSAGFTQPQSVLFGMKNSLKTVIVLSPDFTSGTWSQCEGLVSEVDSVSLHKDAVLIVLQECEVPHLLTDLPYIEANKHGWWTKLLAKLALPDDGSISEEAMLSMSSSLMGLNPGLQSSHLLLSIRSQCGCFGKEMVDPTEVPDELLSHGIQIPEEEYSETILQLMKDVKFRCHVWCYNMPLAIVFFTVLLGLCLVIIPIVETKYFFNGTETGLEYVHGGVVWLCMLTIYMVITHMTRRKMKEKTYSSLSKVNTVFIKYNILVGIENLGLADCNKYYVHFFYYELGPCLAYLQELLVNLEECNQCYTNHISGENTTIDIDCEDQMPAITDQMTVLQNANITNVSMQTHTEDLLLDHSGEYINMMITKKLERPQKQRHVKECYCLCQYVEQRVYKMIV